MGRKKGMKTGSKYSEAVKEAIDKFWLENCYPPTVRDIMRMCNIPSSFHARQVIRAIPNVKIAKRGHPIPNWVINAIQGYDVKPACECRIPPELPNVAKTPDALP